MTAQAVAPTESEFQRQIVQLAHLLGWRVMHVRRSIGRRRGGQAWQTSTSVAGWVDLFMWHVGTGRVLAVELKSDTGRLTAEQKQVLAELEHCGIDARVWRPAAWDEVEAALTMTEIR